jgi:bacillithiol system protein YtxJ
MTATDAATQTLFVPVPEADAVERWLHRPGVGLLFLHDPGCPISAFAYWEVARVGGEVGLANVRATPALAREIERRTGVQHASPQAIVLRDGRAVWSADHLGVSAAAVADALAAAARDGERSADKGNA